MAEKNTLGLDYNKYLADYNKYMPYLGFLNSMSKGGNVAKAGAEAAIDKVAGSVPVYGDIYKGVKLFNQATGGVNFNKMMGIKNPLTQGWNKIWGVKRKKTPEEQAAEDPEYAKYMGMLSDMQNSSAAAERSALEKRRNIQPMQEKAVNDYMDILQNGLSSRQLAPVYAAGEARNRAIGAGAEAGLMQQVQNRGVGGGVQAGLEAAVQANRNNLSADLNSRITQQQIAARPGMLGQAANLTMSLDNQAQQELAQAAMNRLNAAQVGLGAYNAAQQNERMKESIANERAQARATEMGALIGKFGPDIADAIKKLVNKNQGPSTPSANPNSTAILGPEYLAEPGVSDVSQIPPTQSDYSFANGVTLPTMGRDAAQPMFQGGREMPTSFETSTSLSMKYPTAIEGQSYPGPNGMMYTYRGGRWMKSYGNPTIGGLAKRPFDIGQVRPDINDVLDLTGGMLSNTTSAGAFQKF